MSDDPTTSIPPLAPAPTVPPADSFEPTRSVVEPRPPDLEPARPATAPTPAKRASSSGRWLNVLLGVAVVVAVGGVAFAIGRSTAPASAAVFPGAGTFPGNGTFPGAGTLPGASGAPGFGDGGGRVFGLGGGITISGTVQSVTGDTMTITTESGQTVEVTLDDTTEYHEQAEGTASDVTVGADVDVQVSGGFGRANGGNGTQGNGQGGATPSLTASDVTVVP